MKATIWIWIATGIFTICSIGMQIPDFSPDFQNIFSIIAGIIAVLVAPAGMPKIGKPYITIIFILMSALAKIIKIKKSRKFEDAYHDDYASLDDKKIKKK